MANRRILTLEQPGVGGMWPDLETHLLDAQQSAYAENLLVLERGIANQRRGWSWLAAASANVLRTIGGHDFVLAGVGRLLSSWTSGGNVVGVRKDPSSGADTTIWGAASNAEALLRCVYRDQAVFCTQDGVTPARFYSGSVIVDTSSTGGPTITYTAGKATASIGGVANAVVQPGSYVGLSTLTAGADQGPPVLTRILERNTVGDVFTMEDIRTSLGGSAMLGWTARACGLAYPCVSVYEAGTGTLDPVGDTFTGTGTKWVTGAWGAVSAGAFFDDGLLRINPTTGNGFMYLISSVTSDTVLSVFNATGVTDAKYHICRRLPVKDACPWGGGLASAGVKQHPNRVYLSKPNWNPALPPLQTPPFDPSLPPALPDPEDFLLDYIEVPAAEDDDPIVAILPAENRLDVLKTHSVWGITGSWPEFRADLIIDKVGCMDIRSAKSFPQGRFWADRKGIYHELGQVRDIARAGGISGRWRTLAAGFDTAQGDRCTIGVDGDHLLVSIDPRTAATTTLVYDLRSGTWVSEFTNHQAVDYARLNLASLGLEGLYWVGPDAGTGRVANSRPIFNGTGTARDASGHQPNLRLYTGSGIVRAARLGVGARLLQVRVDANLYDSAGAGATMDVSLVDSQRLNDSAPVTTALGTIASKNTDGLATYKLKAGIRAEQHQIRLVKTATPTTEQATEIARIVVSLRDSARAL